MRGAGNGELVARAVLRAQFPDICSDVDFKREFRGRGLVEARAGSICFLWDELLGCPSWIMRGEFAIPRLFHIEDPEVDRLRSVGSVANDKGMKEGFETCSWFPCGAVTSAKIREAYEHLKQHIIATVTEANDSNWEAMLRKRLADEKERSVYTGELTFSVPHGTGRIHSGGLKISTLYFSLYTCAHDGCFEQGTESIVGFCYCKYHASGAKPDSIIQPLRLLKPTLFNVFSRVMCPLADGKAEEMRLTDHTQWLRFLRRLVIIQRGGKQGDKLQHYCSGYYVEISFDIKEARALVFRQITPKHIRAFKKAVLCIYPHCLVRLDPTMSTTRDDGEGSRRTDPLRASYCQYHQGFDKMLSLADIADICEQPGERV